MTKNAVRDASQDILTRIGAYARFGSKLGLSRMEGLLSRLGNPHKDLPVLHVAGTNGKGSVCKYLYEVLRAHGYRVGLYISPFIETFHERIQCDGAHISQEDLERVGERVLAAAEAMVQAGEESPTEFEVITAMALLYFQEQAVDFAVLEVGLGGRGDSTNVVERPLVSLITSIGYDHMDRLGDTIAAIAEAKAGIIKEGVPVVMNVASDEAKRVIARRAYEKHAPLTDLSETPLYDLAVTAEGTSFSTNIRGHGYRDLELSMVGEHQAENAVTALGAIEILRQKGIINVDYLGLREGLKNACQPARFEVLKPHDIPGAYVVLDGAHNAEGMESLLKTVDDVFFGKRILTVMGVLADKAVDDMLFFAEKLGNDFLTVPVASPRALSAEDLANRLRARGKTVETAKDAEAAVQRAMACLAAGEYDVCLFAGSLYLMGSIRNTLKNGFLL